MLLRVSVLGYAIGLKGLDHVTAIGGLVQLVPDTLRMGHPLVTHAPQRCCDQEGKYIFIPSSFLSTGHDQRKWETIKKLLEFMTFNKQMKLKKCWRKCWNGWRSPFLLILIFFHNFSLLFLPFHIWKKERNEDGSSLFTHRLHSSRFSYIHFQPATDSIRIELRERERRGHEKHSSARPSIQTPFISFSFSQTDCNCTFSWFVNSVQTQTHTLSVWHTQFESCEMEFILVYYGDKSDSRLTQLHPFWFRVHRDKLLYLKEQIIIFLINCREMC